MSHQDLTDILVNIVCTLADYFDSPNLTGSQTALSSTYTLRPALELFKEYSSALDIVICLAVNIRQALKTQLYSTLLGEESLDGCHPDTSLGPEKVRAADRQTDRRVTNFGHVLLANLPQYFEKGHFIHPTDSGERSRRQYGISRHLPQNERTICTSSELNEYSNSSYYNRHFKFLSNSKHFK
ncbi:hypothetical protein J6590_002443 [Homalodisca vitripennis]|nr:hypothetical protein J6590_002443 [Homalodisca vitripennis]